MSKEISARVATGPTAPTTAQARLSTGRKALRRAAFKATTAFAAGSLLLVSAGIVHADIVTNDIPGIDAVAKIMPLNVGGAQGTTQLGVTHTNTVKGDPTSDTENGCNFQGAEALKVKFVSSDESVAKVVADTVAFSSCTSKSALTVIPINAGVATISATEVYNDTKGRFDLSTATFTVKVAPAAPSNTAPTLEITGTETGASYPKGSVPTTVCNVTDAEDGSKSPAPTLSPITGDYAADGIGLQTATCSYTDQGGLTVSSSVTYSITDSTPPQITYTLNPSAADGLEGWYKSAVTLEWTVTDPESPVSLTPTGCEPQSIIEDQQAQQYTCSATSAGGSAGPVTANIKKDGIAPAVSYTSPAAGTAGTNGWYTTDMTATFTATDATSGPALAAQTKVSEGEGAAVKVDSPEFRDVAGNVTAAGAASATFKIDKTDPTATFNSTVGTGYFGSIAAQPTCTATDAHSGPAGCVVTGYSTAVGTHTLTATATDMAGNEGTKTMTYTVDPWTANGFYQPVDMGGVFNIVKGGSTVPIKFEMFLGTPVDPNRIELTNPTQMKLSMAKMNCLSTALTDEIETLAATASTSLRYDSTAGQFIYNWKTPTMPGACYKVTMTADDGTTLNANFKLR